MTFFLDFLIFCAIIGADKKDAGDNKYAEKYIRKKIATNKNADFPKIGEARKNGTSGTGEHTDHAIKCVLYDRDCIGCLECETCDLDPNKVCDNCGKCLDIQDVASIKIDKIYTSEEEYEADERNRS